MFKNMITDTHLKPGQKGTKQLVEKYGDLLLCVRYRKDAVRKIRLKTVEIIVEEKDWKPDSLPYRDEDVVPVIVSFSEKPLRDALKKVGGKWDPEENVWHVPYGSIRGNTELEMRILEDQREMGSYLYKVPVIFKGYKQGTLYKEHVPYIRNLVDKGKMTKVPYIGNIFWGGQ